MLAAARPARSATSSSPARTPRRASGNALPLANIPLGTTIHNIELVPGKGGQIVRSAGTSAQLLAKEGDYATVRLPSGEMRRVPLRCMATVGQVSNLDHENQNLGKAGRARHLGPAARGPGRRHEPARPSARRWRGQVPDRDAAQDPVGQARDGLSHPAGEDDRTTHRPIAASQVAGR